MEQAIVHNGEYKGIVSRVFLQRFLNDNGLCVIVGNNFNETASELVAQVEGAIVLPVERDEPSDENTVARFVVEEARVHVVYNEAV